MESDSRVPNNDVANSVDKTIQAIRATSPGNKPAYYNLTPVSHNYDLNRLDNYNRALLAENDLLREKAQKSGEQNAHADWKLRYEESEIQANRYKTLYQNLLAENDRLKSGIHDSHNRLSEALRPDNAVNGNGSHLKLSQDGANSHENANWAIESHTIEVLKAQLNAVEKEKKGLRELIEDQSAVINELRDSVTTLQSQLASYENDHHSGPALMRQMETMKDEAAKKSSTINQHEKDANDLKAQIAALNGGEQRANLLQDDKQRLQEEVQALNRTILEKLEEIRKLQLRVHEVEILEKQMDHIKASNESLTAHVLEQSKEIAELKAKLATLPGVEARLDTANKSIDTLNKIIIDKDGKIADLNKAIALLNIEVTEQKLDLDKMTLVIDQNERLRDDVARLVEEGDKLQEKLVRYSEAERKLVKVEEERDTLNALLSHKMQYINELQEKIAGLEESIMHINDLKERVYMVVHENENLNIILADKIKIISDLRTKCDHLERMFVSVKETTQQLDHVKSKYDTTIRYTEDHNPTLRNSVYGGKHDLYNSRSNNSDALTAGSPTELYNSPAKH